ncbi:hypothetical protein GCM10023170_094800 [Phytohabitans houttuyneae]|uniref:Uncharacterized protein n=1 Tax=Phytohabitans houttuyneae TaxID=1076126 RepID=A0A6V8K9E0_9ACTN|nr:hypothetical protein Phou_015350 [Phytohabitans houttuyneae]
MALVVHHDLSQSDCQKTIDSTQFHTDAIVWTPTSVKWSVDAELVCMINSSVTAWDSNGGAPELPHVLTPNDAQHAYATNGPRWSSTELRVSSIGVWADVWSGSLCLCLEAEPCVAGAKPQGAIAALAAS